MSDFRTLVDGLTFTECPRWRDGRLWLSDFYTHSVLAVDPSGGTERMAEVAAQPSGLGWLPDGRLLIVSMKDRRILRLEDGGGLVEHADLTGLAPWHLNDMVVDATGRAYVGNFGFDLMAGGEARTTNLIRVDPDGSATVVADDLVFPNGMVITPDGSTLIVAESFANRLTAFTVGPDGGLGDRREWAPLSGVAPDGICLDAEGAVWVADALTPRLLRVGEGGTVLEERTTPTPVFACMLGGADGRTLFVSAAATFAEHEASTTRQAAVLMAEVDVPHAGLP
ncbi:MAG TPA: SMP-30/gluconolactonase/LRE family protein [Acidimicrobiales bacterium]|nr:SMP-30/gluconolactonase/LRE family protein [Acidimicrobiales bacterium]